MLETRFCQVVLQGEIVHTTQIKPIKFSQLSNNYPYLKLGCFVLFVLMRSLEVRPLFTFLVRLESFAKRVHGFCFVVFGAEDIEF